MIDARCPVCKNPDIRRGVGVMWNEGMTQAAIRRVVGDTLTTAAVTKHLKEHETGGWNRQVLLEPEAPVRERILALQRLQLDEVERRIELAKQRADEQNAHLQKMRDMGAEGADTTPDHDWSEFTDILGKDMQSAIGSILKTQGLSDKREKVQGELKLGLFEAMTAAGLAPKVISGGKQANEPLEIEANVLHTEGEDTGNSEDD